MTQKDTPSKTTSTQRSAPEQSAPSRLSILPSPQNHITFSTPTMAEYQDSIRTLLQHSPIGFPVAIIRSALIHTQAAEAFVPKPLLEKRYVPFNPETIDTLLSTYITTPEIAYLTAHLIALETALAAPVQFNAMQHEPVMSALMARAIEDARVLAHKHVDALYGYNTTLLDNAHFELIWKSPKVALHEHQRGSVPLAMIRARFISQHDPHAYLKTIELQEQCRIKRMYTHEGKGPLYTPELSLYREKYDLIAKAVYSEQTAYLASYLYTLAMAVDTVRYFEYRFNPMTGKDPLRYTQAIEHGIDDAKAFAFDMMGQAIDANLIFTAYRGNADLHFAAQHPQDAYQERTDNALTVLNTAIELRQKGFRVTGFDIAGDEEAFSINDFETVAETLKFYNQTSPVGQRIGATIHGGETPFSGTLSHGEAILAGADAVNQTIDLFWDKHTPLRIGHGIRAYDNPTVIERCRERNICFEQCPKSNVQTGAVNRYSELPTLALLNQGVPVTLSTDNATISKSNPTNELVKLTRHLNASHWHRKQLQLHGLRSAFLFDNHLKQILLNDLSNGYTTLEAEERFESTLSEEHSSASKPH